MFTNFVLITLTLGVLKSSVTSMPLQKRRFGQESPEVLQEIGALENLANLQNGRFAQIQGGFISTLLAGADACARYPLIDEIVTLCTANNCQNEGISVARKLAALEKNFNPFAGENAKPAFCNNAALPASPQVRCIVPVIDPGFGDNAQLFNGNANARLAQVEANAAGNPGLCAEQSVQEQAIALGVSDCVGCNAAGINGAADNNAADAGNDNAAEGNNAAGNNNDNAGDHNAGNNGAQGNVNPGNNEENGGVQNVNIFTGALLEAPPVVVNDLGADTQRRFEVLNADGSLNGDFLNRNGALTRACSVQKNACSNVANGNGGSLNGITVGDCDQQESECQQINGV